MHVGARSPPRDPGRRAGRAGMTGGPLQARGNRPDVHPAVNHPRRSLRASSRGGCAATGPKPAGRRQVSCRRPEAPHDPRRRERVSPGQLVPVGVKVTRVNEAFDGAGSACEDRPLGRIAAGVQEGQRAHSGPRRRASERSGTPNHALYLAENGLGGTAGEGRRSGYELLSRQLSTRSDAAAYPRRRSDLAGLAPGWREAWREVSVLAGGVAGARVA